VYFPGLYGPDSFICMGLIMAKNKIITLEDFDNPKIDWPQLDTAILDTVIRFVCTYGFVKISGGRFLPYRSPEYKQEDMEYALVLVRKVYHDLGKMPFDSLAQVVEERYRKITQQLLEEEEWTVESRVNYIAKIKETDMDPEAYIFNMEREMAKTSNSIDCFDELDYIIKYVCTYGFKNYRGDIFDPAADIDSILNLETAFILVNEVCIGIARVVLEYSFSEFAERYNTMLKRLRDKPDYHMRRTFCSEDGV
jgi:hypothetical protein